MSWWTDALTDKRMTEARRVYEALAAADWHDLSASDRRMWEALGYLVLERDDVDLANLVDISVDGEN